MPESHKKAVEQFTEIVNSRHVHHLDKVLDDNVEKQENSKIAYKNLNEAREYYSMEHEAHPNVQWKIVGFEQEDQHGNSLIARISYDNHTYKTTYTFSSAGKIQKIHSVLEQQH